MSLGNAGIEDPITASVAGRPGVDGAPGPSDIAMVSGEFFAKDSTLLRIGGREIDMSLYPATLNGKTRHIKFYAILEATTVTAQANLVLRDVTHGVDVTGTATSTTSSAPFLFVSADLTVGSAAGNLRDDVITEYEVQLSMPSGSPTTDRAICTSARLFVTYV